jgi:hypothetical protein
MADHSGRAVKGHEVSSSFPIAIVRLEGLGQLNEKSIGNRSRDLPASSIVSQSTTLSRASILIQYVTGSSYAIG